MNMQVKSLMRDFLNKILLNFLPVSFLRKYYVNISKPCQPNVGEVKQLLIDVSVIAKVDAETGIQRVVRNLYQELLASSPIGYKICPISGSRKQGYHYLATDFLEHPATEQASSTASFVQVRTGDIFLGLDLAAHIIPNRTTELIRWKQQGVRMCFVVYDLLPVLEPTWFNYKTTLNFKRWLRSIAILADDVISISNVVKTDFSTWIKRHFNLNEQDITCKTIQLGAELNSRCHTNVKVDNINNLPTKLTEQKFILMVGTLEPRKGYADALNALELLWAAGEEVKLVIVGKAGWKVEAFVSRLQSRIQVEEKLYWMPNISDEILQSLYQGCSGVIMASHGEGFGLPLIEAAYFNKPVLARDIPIFREIGNESTSYFADSSPAALSQAITDWLIKINQAQLTNSNFFIPTWHACSQQLLKLIIHDFESTENSLNPSSAKVTITSLDTKNSSPLSWGSQ